MSARVYWLWLATRPGIGARVAAGLLEHFGNPETVYMAGRGSLLMCDGLTAAQVNVLSDKNLDEADRIIAECTEKNIHILTLEDSGYPDRLRNIYDPPLVLYWCGKEPAWDTRPMISIVGTRRATSYGRLTAYKFGRSLTECGFLVVSGMASGVDGEANRGALQAGSTIAVLGCGVDVCYPQEQRYLYGDLRLAGTLISEYPPGTEPAGWHFPQRNRIISGLSVATIVIEAPFRSGALITARLALDQGRDVYAVPSRLDERQSEGCNALIRDHEADLLTDPLQLLHAYGDLLRTMPDERRVLRAFRNQPDREPVPAPRRQPEKQKPEPSKPSALPRERKPRPANPAPPLPRQEAPAAPAKSLSEAEQRIVDAVRAGAQSTDQLIQAADMPASQLLPLLTMLELDGLIRNEGGVITLQ